MYWNTKYVSLYSRQYFEHTRAEEWAVIGQRLSLNGGPGQQLILHQYWKYWRARADGSNDTDLLHQNTVLHYSVQRESRFNFRDGIENICLSISCPRRDQEFLSSGLTLWDEIEIFFLSISCFETSTRIFSFNLVLRDEHENFST